MSIEALSVLGVLFVLALGTLYAVAGSRLSEQWAAWIRNAVIAAGGAFAIGMLLLGLPGAVFVEFLTASGRKLPPDSEWPLAIQTTAVAAFLIVPASLSLQLLLPTVAGWPHVLATAASTSIATLLFAMIVTREPAPTQGPDSLSGHVLFDYSPNNRIIVGGGLQAFTLHLSPTGSRSVYILSTPSDIDRIAHVKDAQRGQLLQFRSFDNTSRFYYAHPGDHVLIRNTNGYHMQIKIISAKAKGHEGDARNEVVFDYQINEDKSASFSAL